MAHRTSGSLTPLISRAHLLGYRRSNTRERDTSPGLTSRTHTPSTRISRRQLVLGSSFYAGSIEVQWNTTSKDLKTGVGTPGISTARREAELKEPYWGSTPVNIPVVDPPLLQLSRDGAIRVLQQSAGRNDALGKGDKPVSGVCSQGRPTQLENCIV